MSATLTPTEAHRAFRWAIDASTAWSPATDPSARAWRDHFARVAITAAERHDAHACPLCLESITPPGSVSNSEEIAR